MKLKELAAKDNLFLIGEMPQKFFKNEYFAKNFAHYKTKQNYHIKELPEFIKNNDNLESGLFFEVREQLVNNSGELELYYIENCYWLVKHKDFDFYTMLTSSWNAKGKMFFQLPFSFYNKYNNISNFLKSEATKKIISPSNIGVFTDKKILDWFNYNKDFLNAYSELKDNVDTKNNELQSEIDNFICALNGKCKISIHDNSTYINTDIFEVTFQIFKDQNYLSKKINFKGGLNEIISITNIK